MRDLERHQHERPLPWYLRQHRRTCLLTRHGERGSPAYCSNVFCFPRKLGQRLQQTARFRIYACIYPHPQLLPAASRPRPKSMACFLMGGASGPTEKRVSSTLTSPRDRAGGGFTTGMAAAFAADRASFSFFACERKSRRTITFIAERSTGKGGCRQILKHIAEHAPAVRSDPDCRLERGNALSPRPLWKLRRGARRMKTWHRAEAVVAFVLGAPTAVARRARKTRSGKHVVCFRLLLAFFAASASSVLTLSPSASRGFCAGKKECPKRSTSRELY